MHAGNHCEVETQCSGAVPSNYLHARSTTKQPSSLLIGRASPLHESSLSQPPSNAPRALMRTYLSRALQSPPTQPPTHLARVQGGVGRQVPEAQGGIPRTAGQVRATGGEGEAQHCLLVPWSPPPSTGRSGRGLCCRAGPEGGVEVQMPMQQVPAAQ